VDNQPVVENFTFKATFATPCGCFCPLPALIVWLTLSILALSIWSPQAQAAPLRVVSLDMCADAYGLGLLPPEAILAVSRRAALPESYYRDRARDHRQVKPSLEAILALKPEAVLRTWGGDISLIQALGRKGIKIIQINDINDFPQARSELLRVGEALGVAQAANNQAMLMDKALNSLPRGLSLGGRSKSALYYTSQSYTAGAGTWPGHLLETLGYKLATKEAGYAYISPEAFLNLHPDVYALGYFDNNFDARYAPGRHPLVRQHMQKATVLEVPSTALSCGAWYAAFALKDTKLKAAK
jgi:iron complex transport system substrate-binding protein